MPHPSTAFVERLFAESSAKYLGVRPKPDEGKLPPAPVGGTRLPLGAGVHRADAAALLNNPERPAR